MIELLQGLFQAATSPSVMFAALAGVAIGIVGGALPGVSASITMALVLPFTYGMDPVSGIVLLGSVYVGAEYGGSIPAILIRTPGTNAAAATVVDGYEMYRQGKGSEALGLSLVAGVIGGLVGMIALILMARPLAEFAIRFTAPAMFALGLLGLSLTSSLSGSSPLKGFAAAVVGLMIATVGTDPVSGAQRFTFGQADLIGGIKPVLLMMGIFAVTEIMVQASSSEVWQRVATSVRTKLPSLLTMWRCRVSLVVGSALGIFEGLTPGGGGSIAAFLAYNEAKRWSKKPEEFGKGSPEGIVAPEAANNTVASASLIPTLSLGIPGSGSAAVLLGGLMLHGMVPGPLLFQKNPEFINSLYGGLIIANLSQIPIGMMILVPCIWLVNRPKPWLLACIFALIVSGVYSIDGSVLDMWIVLGAGVLGYLLRILGIPFLPLILGVVLGYMIESNYRRSLLISGGSHSIFFTDVLSASMLGIALLILVAPAYGPLVRLLRSGGRQPSSSGGN